MWGLILTPYSPGMCCCHCHQPQSHGAGLRTWKSEIRISLSASTGSCRVKLQTAESLKYAGGCQAMGGCSLWLWNKYFYTQIPGENGWEKACEALLWKPAKSDPGAFLTSSLVSLLLPTLFLHEPLINCSLVKVCCMSCGSQTGTEQAAGSYWYLSKYSASIYYFLDHFALSPALLSSQAFALASRSLTLSQLLCLSYPTALKGSKFLT